jgi:hypothetical protein
LKPKPWADCETLLRVANPDPEATLIAKAGASKPSTTAVTNISTLFGPAKTIASADRPEIKLKQILQIESEKYLSGLSLAYYQLIN